MSILRYKNKVMFADGGVLRDSGGGGGGGGTPVQQTVSNTSIPEYARPYVETMLGQAQAVTDLNQNPYQPYAGQRVAGFTPMQAQAFQNIAGQQIAPQLGQATNIAGQVAQGAFGTQGTAADLQGSALGYGAQGAGYGAQGAQQAGLTAEQAGQQAAMYGLQGSQYGGQAAGLAPQAQQYGAQAAGIGMGGLGYGAQGAMAGAQAAGYGAQGANIGQNVANMSTNAAAQQAYMSPYIQNALDPTLREMQRQYGITGAQEQGMATRAGAFGGSREALMAAENQRNKNIAMNQAIGQGYNTAFTNAQNQMNQAAALGMQGTQQGIVGQQAAMQGAGVGLSGINTAMQGQQAGLAGLGQAGSLYAQGMQGAQTGLSGVGQQLAAGNLGLAGTAQGMQGAQAGLSGVGAATQAGQYGLAGLGTANQAASTLGALGQTQYGQQSGINQAMYTAGAAQQGLAQQNLTNQYQDYLTQLNYPYQQLGFMSNILRGIPLAQQSNAVYQASPSSMSQLAGLGTAGAGLYGLTKKKGGSIKEGSGLADIQLHKLVG